MEKNEIEILNIEIGGLKIKDMTAITFVGWLAKKVNNLSVTNSDSVWLISKIKNPPMGRMLDEDKIEAVRKLMNLNIEIK
jgi:glucose-6-phosphate dehydrogenase assembly protein OpcA